MAAKEKSVFFCTECGFEASKWMGQCPACKSWNTFSEEKVKVQKNKVINHSDRPAPTSIGTRNILMLKNVLAPFSFS